MGSTHAATAGLAGVAVVAAGAPLVGTEADLVALGWGLAAGAGAGLLPDLDHPESTATRSQGPASQTLSRAGTAPPAADAHSVHRFDDITAAAVVDGIGHSPETVAWAPVAAEAAARVGARRNDLVGVLAAAEMTAGGRGGPDGVAVLAVAAPGETTAISWVGDCRAYTWDGRELTPVTTDQTMGQWLRTSGGPAVSLEQAAGHDHWVLATVGTATIATVRMVEALVRAHAEDPQALAEALVAAAEDDEDGYRDDATAAVLRPVSETAPIGDAG